MYPIPIFSSFVVWYEKQITMEQTLNYEAQRKKEESFTQRKTERPI